MHHLPAGRDALRLAGLVEGTTLFDRMDLLDEVVSKLQRSADTPFAQRCPSAFHVPTSKAWTTCLLSAVWMHTGLDVLRPQSALEALVCWLFFMDFASVYWIDRTTDGKATPCVVNNYFAILTAKWARSAYEQLCLYWVYKLVEAAGSACFRLFCGWSGWMVADPREAPSVSVANVVALLEQFPTDAISECNFNFDSAMSAVKHLATKERDSSECTPYPVMIHLYGEFKKFHREAAGVLWSYYDAERMSRCQAGGACWDFNGLGASLSRAQSPCFLSKRQLRAARTAWVSILISNYSSLHVFVSSDEPKKVILYCAGLGYGASKLPPVEWFPDSVIVAFVCEQGYGATASVPDAGSYAASVPQGMDFTDMALARLLEDFADELKNAGYLAAVAADATVARFTYRVLLMPAHFRPPDATLLSMWSTCLKQLRFDVAREYGIPNGPLIVSESAGTHTAAALHGLLCDIDWRPSRVVLSAYAMSASLMHELLVQGDRSRDLSGFLFVVNSYDRLCLVPRSDAHCWNQLRQRGASVVFTDQACLLTALS